MKQGQVRAARKTRAGFTIIEVVLAMGILMFGASAIIGFLTFGAATTRQAQLRTTAASSLEAVIADIDRNLFPYEDGELGEPVEFKEREVPGAPGVVYSAKAAANPDFPREYRVDVELSWQSAGVQRSKEIQLLRLREVPFGERLRREFVEGSGGFQKNND
jgi:Prokaryotic N-terminal methylation motif